MFLTASWLVTFLANHPEWASKARIEVEELIASHTDFRVSGGELRPAQFSTRPQACTPNPDSATSFQLSVTAKRTSTSHTSSPLLPTFPSRSTPCHPCHETGKRGSLNRSLSQKRKWCNSDSDSGLESNLEELRRSSREPGEKTEMIEFADAGDVEKNLGEGRFMSESPSFRNVDEARRQTATLTADMKERIPVPPPQQPFSGSTPSSPPTSKSEPSAKNEQGTHSISQTLKRIPLEAWEHSMPVMDALIKETLRVAQPHTAMRRNVGPEFYIDGKLIPTGAYVVYPFSDVHLDEDMYEDAWKFDPGRWLDGDQTEMKEGKGVPFGYVGWGGGTSLDFFCFK